MFRKIFIAIAVPASGLFGMGWAYEADFNSRIDIGGMISDFNDPAVSAGSLYRPAPHQPMPGPNHPGHQPQPPHNPGHQPQPPMPGPHNPGHPQQPMPGPNHPGHQPQPPYNPGHQPQPPMPGPHYPQYDPNHSIRKYYSRDCASFVFAPDSSLVSGRVRLDSREYLEECRTNPNGYRDCDTHVIGNFSSYASMAIQERGLLPWESEKFETCLEGPRLNFYTIRAAYSYSVRAEGSDYDRHYVLYPQGKIATDPDENGMSLQFFDYDPGVRNFKMAIADKWADYYAGEKSEIYVRLIKNRQFWGDQTIVERNITLPSASVYEIDFKSFSDLANLKSGEYFVSWGFKRIGSISSLESVDKGQTNRIVIK